MYREELSFGKIGENKSTLKFSDKYALFHNTFNNKKLIMSPGKVLVGISYDKLCGYLEGASLGKTKEEFFMWNGISTSARDSWFPGVEFIRLDKGELEKLLSDTDLKRRFEKEIRIVG